ncbi:glycosyltransferase family 2 protein [Vibrio cyclitrophicus]|uniref:glycosyltransferase family 2 protein n=1 Tax=Vibrio TaxID=662 RepID=UPI00029ABA83|nr:MULTISPECIES: glycosyltransferase [Vibrio]MBY7659946.1 glycosyltransferase [Vibrio atlanticus]ERM61150.1 Beta-1,3-glucosyltransferase [Vibrio cyclitrophicus FF75]MBE8555274.1 glycosyltransferase [Vibrio sp. OPT24]OED67489.1 glycosyl transferase [Vibrio cyclitrophicus ZF99]OED92212.1 glycosyl transferase [Vibrio cyclitrophicus ZF30]|tara:strand:+ start:782 stop:1510 length:729 start_codon:yes stop_codon:yes gene_type:complete
MEPVSIIVITLNEEKRIGRLMEKLSVQTHQEFEVIVVDSNSEDNTREVAQAYESALPNLTVHHMETRGVSLGRNTGASLAQYNRILFLDADVSLPRNFLAKALYELDEKKLEVAGVYMSSKGLPLVHKFGYGVFNAGLFATQFFFPTAIGACIFSTKRVHDEIGGFDEEIVLCEDCDYVKRASKTWRFRFLNMTFGFDPRRLDQDGVVKTGSTYLKANVRRFFKGEMRNNEMNYKFGHYKEQ